MYVARTFEVYKEHLTTFCSNWIKWTRSRRIRNNKITIHVTSFFFLGCALFMGKITSGSLLLDMRPCNTWPYVANQDVFFQATRKHTKSCLYQPNLLPSSLLHCPENFADTSWANFTFIWYMKYHCRDLGRRRMKLLKLLAFLSMRFQILHVCILELLK